MVWLRVSHEVAIKLLAGATVSEFLTRAGGSTSKLTHMAMAEASSPHGLFQSCSQHDFPKTSDLRVRGQERDQNETIVSFII